MCSRQTHLSGCQGGCSSEQESFSPSSATQPGTICSVTRSAREGPCIPWHGPVPPLHPEVMWPNFHSFRLPLRCARCQAGAGQRSLQLEGLRGPAPRAGGPQGGGPGPGPGCEGPRAGQAAPRRAAPTWAAAPAGRGGWRAHLKPSWAPGDGAAAAGPGTAITGHSSLPSGLRRADTSPSPASPTRAGRLPARLREPALSRLRSGPHLPAPCRAVPRQKDELI